MKFLSILLLLYTTACSFPIRTNTENKQPELQLCSQACNNSNMQSFRDNSIKCKCFYNYNE